MAKLLYLGEIGYRNAGDEVMWDIFKQEARRFISNELDVLEACRQEYAHISAYDIIVLGGGSLLAPSYISLLSKAMELKSRSTFGAQGSIKLPEEQVLTAY